MQSTPLLSTHDISTKFTPNAFRLQNTIIYIKMPSYTKANIKEAIQEVYKGRSMHKALIVHGILYSTLKDRLHSTQTRTESHVHQQRLSPIQESTDDS